MPHRTAVSSYLAAIFFAHIPLFIYLIPDDQQEKTIMDSKGAIVPPGEGSQLPFIAGEVLIWKATGATTGGALDCFETQLEPQVGPREHIHHRNDETFYVLEGDFRFKVGERVVDISAGGFIFVPRGTPHTWKNIGIGQGRLLIVFTPGSMAGYFEEISPLISTIVTAVTNNLEVEPSILAEAEAIQQRYHYELVAPRLP